MKSSETVLSVLLSGDVPLSRLDFQLIRAFRRFGYAWIIDACRVAGVTSWSVDNLANFLVKICCMTLRVR